MQRYIPLYPLALLALILSALAPQGFMPRAGADGFVIALCSGSAPSELAISPDNPDYDTLALLYGGDQNDRHDMGDESGQPDCAFAAAPALAFVSPPPALPVQLSAPALHEPQAARRFAVGSTLRIPPATGPPAKA